MRIVLVTEMFSEGMGYTENCLPKAFAQLGNDVHVITSNMQVYGNLPSYAATYGRFLGPATVPVGTLEIDGFRVHRLPHRLLGGYIAIRGLIRKVRELKPEVVQANAAGSISTFMLAAARRLIGYQLFSECHQHLSVVHPYLKEAARPTQWSGLKRAAYFLSRTLPGHLASLETSKCYAIAPDCVEVAHRFYGVPLQKIALMPLGTDTDVFRPSVGEGDAVARSSTRARFGFAPEDVVCIYTGRFSDEKNPFLLAQAVSNLRRDGHPIMGLFVGDGAQRKRIEAQDGCVATPFVPARSLPELYRAAEIAVWPAQESMSMLDAASSGLPIVVSDRMADTERVAGNGCLYREGNADDLARVIASLLDAQLRNRLGVVGRRKMIASFSWRNIAEKRLRDYALAVGLDPRV